jgi:hypothetical protein
MVVLNTILHYLHSLGRQAVLNCKFLLLLLFMYPEYQICYQYTDSDTDDCCISMNKIGRIIQI